VDLVKYFGGTFYCRLTLMVLLLRHASLLAVKCMSWASNLSMAKGHTVIAGWFAGRTWTDNNK
jgi:hypothetical protein